MEPQSIELSLLAKALASLDEALHATRTAPSPSLRQLMRDAAIQRFEFSFEMSWKTLRRVLLSLGHREVGASPRGILRMGRQESLVDDVKAWFAFPRHGTLRLTWMTMPAWSSYLPPSRLLQFKPAFSSSGLRRYAMNLSDEDLECLRSGLTESIRERPLIARVVGSFARGEEVRSSDLDLMIQISRAMTFSEMASLREWFDASNLPYIVDLVDYHQVAPERLSRMLKGACVILDY